MTAAVVGTVEVNNISSTPEISASTVVPTATTSPSPLTVGVEPDSPWRDIPDVVVASRQDSIPPITPPRSPEKEVVMNPLASATNNSKNDSTPQIVNSLVHPEFGDAETLTKSSPMTVNEPPRYFIHTAVFYLETCTIIQLLLHRTSFILPFCLEICIP